jgi:hypothetical protein
VAEERIEDRLDDDTAGQARRVSAEEPDRTPEDDVEGARRHHRLGETEEDVEGHKRKR